jgi:hypothetical protein
MGFIVLTGQFSNEGSIGIRKVSVSETCLNWTFPHSLQAMV